VLRRDCVGDGVIMYGIAEVVTGFRVWWSGCGIDRRLCEKETMAIKWFVKVGIRYCGGWLCMDGGGVILVDLVGAWLKFKVLQWGNAIGLGQFCNAVCMTWFCNEEMRAMGMYKVQNLYDGCGWLGEWLWRRWLVFVVGLNSGGDIWRHYRGKPTSFDFTLQINFLLFYFVFCCFSIKKIHCILCSFSSLVRLIFVVHFHCCYIMYLLVQCFIFCYLALLFTVFIKKHCNSSSNSILNCFQPFIYKKKKGIQLAFCIHMCF